MKNINRILWGVVLVAVGVLFGLKALDIIDFNIFFDGWWTLIIIIPSLISLITQRDKTGSFIGLFVGVVLFLASRDIISFATLWKLVIPAVIIIIGLSLIFKDVFNKRAKEAVKKLNARGAPLKECTATFSGQKVSYPGENFYGAELTAVFGGIDCDLRGAVITEDTVINVCCIFGGIDVFLPSGVNVEICTTPVFGGVSNKTNRPFTAGLPTVFINGTCVFGGVDVK